MRRLVIAAGLAFLPSALCAVDKVPEFEITDTYVTGPTMLVRAGANGEIKEIWSGMDSKRMRHVPLFLETSVSCQVRKGSEWQDLRSLKYHHDGTRPGFIRLRSDNGLVSIEITSRRDAGPAPVFVRYAFAAPVDLRLSARFKYPEFSQAFHSEDACGLA